MKAIGGTEFCQHAHVGFLAHGQIHIQYADGCTVEFAAPQAVAIEPGHDGWVVGDEPAVMIEFDFERDTVRRLGMPAEHPTELVRARSGSVELKPIVYPVHEDPPLPSPVSTHTLHLDFQRRRAAWIKSATRAVIPSVPGHFRAVVFVRCWPCDRRRFWRC